VFSVKAPTPSPQIGKRLYVERERKYKNKNSGIMGKHKEQC
jgi:hypothetical protein